MPIDVQGSGLSDKEMEICDSFVYIPQNGPGTASLNVTVAASIVLHQFAGMLTNKSSIYQFPTTPWLIRYIEMNT
jgi:tRNA C32,U32 (ribose-2'-O)-methylase TrmJ